MELTEEEREFLKWALCQAEDVMFSRDGFTSDDWTNLTMIRMKLAAE